MQQSFERQRPKVTTANSRLRQTIKRILPHRVVSVISANRWWKSMWKRYEIDGMHDLCRKLVLCQGNQVRFGPFAGLKLPTECVLASGNSCGLLGTYEMELHPWFQKLCANNYERILDVGSSDGYYAVGMALLTGLHVDAFDTASTARRLSRSTAELNGLSRLVHVRSYCSPKILLALDGQRAFILSDCEGFELSLFTDDVIRALANSDLLIELHDRTGQHGTTRRILELRLRSTHDVQIIKYSPRSLSDFPDPNLLETLGRSDAFRAITEEVRGANQEWLIATSRHPAVRNTECSKVDD
jgi:hypothetical protein